VDRAHALLDEAVRIAKQHCKEAIIRLAPCLAKFGDADKALLAVQAIDYEPDRSRALAALAPHLPKSLHDEALVVALSIKHENDYGEPVWLTSGNDNLNLTPNDNPILTPLNLS